jgi:hypothetical protein
MPLTLSAQTTCVEAAAKVAAALAANPQVKNDDVVDLYKKILASSKEFMSDR